MARRLYAAAGEPKELWLIEGANHYQAMQEMPEQTHPRLLAFFEKSCEGGHRLQAFDGLRPGVGVRAAVRTRAGLTPIRMAAVRTMPYPAAGSAEAQ